MGPGDVLWVIRSGFANTRREILEYTGLSRVTVSQRVDRLLAAGFVREVQDPKETGGRPASRLEFAPQRRFVLTAAIELAHTEIAIVDVDGNVCSRSSIPITITDGPERTIRGVGDALDQLRDDVRIDLSQVCAVALSVPGPVDPVTHRLNDAPVMPGWDDWPVIEALRDRFGVPVILENDADAMAYGEYRRIAPAGDPPFLLVKVSSFIGAGFIVHGEIFRGFDGGAGDVGHVRIGGDARCRCGRTGCLASVASGAAIAERLQIAGDGRGADVAVAALAAAGDEGVLRELEQAGGLIGTVLSTVVTMLNPAAISVAGTLAVPPLVESLRGAILGQTLPHSVRNLRITTATLGEDAAALGLGRVAVDEVFAPGRVNLALGVLDA